ncbi:MAG: TIGR02300 family protein [Alphaproteobacteria bacterium]|nr:TIGR02300 family protein [Alphaproteobacteria bacterium]
MAKPEWGTKRQCNSCGARFYDLMKQEIACPKCGTGYDPDAATKSRRTRPAAEKPVEVREVVVVPVVPVEAPEVAAEGGQAAEGDEALIEDGSDLGEDEDDMAEVIENVEDEGER